MHIMCGLRERVVHALPHFCSLAAVLALTISSAYAQTLSAAGIVNAASYAGGSVSPGEIVTIFGSFPGPAGLFTLQLDNRGYVSTNLGGEQVLFDGVPAPMI